MKKLIITISLLFSIAFAQEKKDTTVATTMKLNEYKSLLYAIDQNIDSKKVSKEILDFIQRHTTIVADKPKEIKK